MNFSRETEAVRGLTVGEAPAADLLQSMVVNLQLTRSLMIQFTPEMLALAGDTCGTIPSPELLELIQGLLQQKANEASVRGDLPIWRYCLETMLHLRPGDTGYVFQLMRPLSELGDYSRVIELMEPIAFLLTDHPEALAQYTSFYVSAAYRLGRLDLVTKIRDGRAAAGMPAPEAEAALRRIASLERAGFSDIFTYEDPLEFNRVLSLAALALDEFAVIQALKNAEALGDGVADSRSLSLSLAIAGFMREESWSRPYRAALGLAASCLSRTGNVEAARRQWLASNLPGPGLEAFLVMAERRAELLGAPALDSLRKQPEWLHTRNEVGLAADADGERALADAFAMFHAAPSLETASRLWSMAYVAGRFTQIAQTAPVGLGPESPFERARTLQVAPLKGTSATPLWVLLTWHVEPDHMLQKLAAYAGDAKIILSVGSDAHPPGLARSTAALFCRNVHFLVRPVVAWGGQRGWHHNLLEVMEQFSRQAEPNAWLQLVCDRTYPLVSLPRLATRTSLGQAFRPNYSTSAWRKEWSEEVVDDLPKVYAGAMEEAFTTAAPKQFIELSTRSPMHGNSDFRLVASTFNFASEPLPIVVGGRSSVHRYMVSPYEADVKWMSFARLQELVDLSTEIGATFSRRLHPTVMRWAYSVLMKYQIRTGDPWVYISRKFVDRVLNDEGFDELFTVMNLGFAPEMNFLDTCTASFNLYDDISHHFHIVPSEVATDIALPQACSAADQLNKSFIRKTDPTESAGLMAFFAERIFEEHVGQGLHWIVAIGEFAADLDEPRPLIDPALLERFIGRRVDVRDLIGSRITPARFDRGCITAIENESVLATWGLEENTLVVTYADSQLGLKRYERAGGDHRVFTLAPAELVSPLNAWSAFLDFHLDDLRTDLDPEKFGSGRAQSALVQPSKWTGAATSEPAILSAFADTERFDIPTPTKKVDGGTYALREVDGVLVGLFSLDGYPAFLQVAGFAEARRRTAVHLKSAPLALAARWDEGKPSAVDGVLTRSGICGVWTLDLFEGAREVTLTDDNWITDMEGERTGRWFLREDGLQVLGLDGVRFGLADHIRLEDGAWRLSGWGWRNFKEAVSFVLHREAPH